MNDHYRTLGIGSGAAPAEIRRAYLRLARLHHPDHHVGESKAVRARHERMMREVNEAWEILGSGERRAEYDRERSEGRSSGTEADGLTMPAGKGWTPRSGDRGWQTDFAAWRDEDARLPEDPPGSGTGPMVLVPSALIVLAVFSGFIGVVLESRALMAVAFGAFIAAVLLFIILPFRELIRSRSGDPTGGTAADGVSRAERR